MSNIAQLLEATADYTHKLHSSVERLQRRAEEAIEERDVGDLASVVRDTLDAYEAVCEMAVEYTAEKAADAAAHDELLNEE